ncbi:flagellar biosynthesis anti-sigma factor FlgM [Chania multitudinisentens]|uniref:flagellar biosynthesis anti-sigma factor FlgM n=1 Tax=Chania multitudinisentens TaxID=1639108 RepID=UPI0003E1291F|nr:flagellar biosynthesis anti-sigma factor FlgM [Chania multitudinisentens]
MKITGSQFNQTREIDKTSSTKRSIAPDEELRVERITRMEQVLSNAQATLAAMPEVDTEQVEKMKKAIAHGEIGLDAHALTKAIRQFFLR